MKGSPLNQQVVQAVHLLSPGQRRAVLWMPSNGMSRLVFNTKPRPPVHVLYALLAIDLLECDVSAAGECWRLTELGLGVRAALKAEVGVSTAGQASGVTSSDGRLLTSEQCRKGRDVLGWSTEDLAQHARVGKDTIDRFEMRMSNSRPRTLKAILGTFDAAGLDIANATLR